MDFTPAFHKNQSQEEHSLEGEVLNGSIPQGLKRSLGQLMQHEGKIPRRNASAALWPVSMETIQETCKALMLADLDWGIPQFISNG